MCSSVEVLRDVNAVATWYYGDSVISRDTMPLEVGMRLIRAELTPQDFRERSWSPGEYRYSLEIARVSKAEFTFIVEED